MQARFLLGPAGTGKTFLCLAGIREALATGASGPPLIFLAPRQATFQLERQLLADESLRGYTRLQILSFHRLAEFVLERTGATIPPLLSEEGRSMVLHALLARRRADLEILGASARMAGFARQLGQELRQLQRRQLSPELLRVLAESPNTGATLRRKLRDLALLLTDYLAWLREHGLQDADCLLDLAANALKRSEAPQLAESLWMDGFAEMTAQELGLLAAVAPRCEKLTLAFCIEKAPGKTPSSWLSIWGGIECTFRQCWDRLAAVSGAKLTVEILPREQNGRFEDAPALGHLEAHWTEPLGFGSRATDESLRAVICAKPVSEAVMAAREVLRFVRSGGRFREVAVLLRAMEAHQDDLRRIFSRYEIPFFMDRRESVAHHPLAELTRSVVRATAFGWRHDDWFGALKTGLVVPEEEQIDRLENEALARGWSGEAWFKPLAPDDPKADWAERLRIKWIGPFAKFRRIFRPNGAQLATAIRQLWKDLGVEKTLEEWAVSEAKDGAVHATVWRQLNSWLEDLSLAFAEEPMTLQDWTPILETGLAELSVGVVPPALDQVLIGSVDRSRNPDLKLAILLGVNETVFPSAPPEGNLLNETDCEELARNDIRLGYSRREFLSRERFLGYIAFTRSRQRLVVACSERDNANQPLNPSPFFSQLKSLFGELKIERITGPDWTRAEHLCELSGQLARSPRRGPQLTELLSRPAFINLRERISSTPRPDATRRLAPELAAQLYGTELRTSVSRLEEFAACSFKFFVQSGLRAEERQRFEFDTRQRGSFQHEALALFHHQLRVENKHWRDVIPDEARLRIRDCVNNLLPQFNHGLLGATPQSRFSVRVVTESLQDFVAATVAWMAHYEFDPEQSELGFGTEDGKLPPWELELGSGRRLVFRGKIDRVDLCRDAKTGQALAVVIDYKSGARKLEELRMANSLQLQLPAYLSVIRHLSGARELFGVERVDPAGVFYVNLRGQSEGAQNRTLALQSREQFLQKRYQHSGRFDEAALRQLDNSNGASGQFKFKIRADGKPHARATDLMRTEAFHHMLDRVEGQLVKMGREIYEGVIALNPYQIGTEVACDKCLYKSICRFDSWSQSYRLLTSARDETDEVEQ